MNSRKSENNGQLGGGAAGILIGILFAIVMLGGAMIMLNK